MKEQYSQTLYPEINFNADEHVSWEVLGCNPPPPPPPPAWNRTLKKLGNSSSIAAQIAFWLISLVRATGIF